MWRDERVARGGPPAEVMHGQTGCMVLLNDMADRAPEYWRTVRLWNSAATNACAI